MVGHMPHLIKWIWPIDNHVFRYGTLVSLLEMESGAGILPKIIVAKPLIKFHLILCYLALECCMAFQRAGS